VDVVRIEMLAPRVGSVRDSRGMIGGISRTFPLFLPHNRRRKSVHTSREIYRAMKNDKLTIKEWAGKSQWRACRADLARFRKNGYSGWGSEGFWALVIHRLRKVVNECRPRWVWMPARFILAIVNKLFTIVTHMDIHPDAQIGPGLLIPHVGPLRVHGNTKIGAECDIHHVCSIGALPGQTKGGATIGDHVYIGCHTSIVGAVTIGDGATIAANTLVISDIPPGATAIGVPARILPPMPRR
jgi:serine O-acetyltransferase